MNDCCGPMPPMSYKERCDRDDAEARLLVSDDILLAAMKAWHRSDAYWIDGNSEAWKNSLRRALATVLKSRV